MPSRVEYLCSSLVFLLLNYLIDIYLIIYSKQYIQEGLKCDHRVNISILLKRPTRVDTWILPCLFRRTREFAIDLGNSIIDPHTILFSANDY